MAYPVEKALDSCRLLLASINHLLPPDGSLFLGSAEQPADSSLGTSVIEGGTCYFRPRQPN